MLRLLVPTTHREKLIYIRTSVLCVLLIFFSVFESFAGLNRQVGSCVGYKEAGWQVVNRQVGRL